MSRRALVSGGGITGVQTALDLADAGLEVCLLEESPRLAPEEAGNLVHNPRLVRALTHPNIHIFTGARLAQAAGQRGKHIATITRQPRYIDIEKCVGCGRCQKACPVDIRDKSRLGQKAVHCTGAKSAPSAYDITKDGLAPCTATCPAGVNTHGYVALISQGKISQALDLITEAVPFPRVLGRVCSHPCERKCTRGKVDYPVSVCALKRYAADVASAGKSLDRTQHANGVKVSGKPRVAIIGAGPAGLTAARDLARMGHKSTVFEALPAPGGMITVGMPRFRLPREIRQADIDDIVKLGIEIRTSTPIGPQHTIEDLRRQGYEAILIATGAHRNQRLGIAGETLTGVIDSIALLQALNLKQPINVGAKVVVIGGGYTAIDSARTAVRLRCQRVLILYRRSLEEMPANAEEVAEAREEGVEIEYLVAPVRIIGKEGKVVGVECIRMGLGEPDASGRRRPIPIEGSEFSVEADSVIVAVGQRPDLSFLGESTLVDGKKYISTDRLSMATRLPGIFAAGDVCGETGTLIDAIAAGRRAAISIDRYLTGAPEERPQPRELPAAVDLDKTYIPQIERQVMPTLPLGERVGNFEEVDLGLSAAMAANEAGRCLNCAGCSTCLECERACELGAVDHKARATRTELDFDVIVGNGVPAGAGIYQPAGDLAAASALAADIIASLGKFEPRPAPCPAPPKLITGDRTGVFVCRCGGAISDVLDTGALVRYARQMPGTAYAAEIDYACTAEAGAKIRASVAEQGLARAVLAACSCCNLDQACYSCTDRRVICKSRLLNSGALFDFVNIREQCAWAHRSQPAAAAAKARALVRGAVARLASGAISLTGTAVVEPRRCRSCGTCAGVCPAEAISIDGYARVDAAQCNGCGMCLAHCPSGALSHGGYSDSAIAASLGALLGTKQR